MTTLKKETYDVTTNSYYQKSKFDVFDQYNTEFWDIDETISELAYLTHDYFRYYGKFPSKVGRLIIEDRLNSNQLNTDEDFIFDNYEGSGTSLVEGKLFDLDSIGIDISPFAVLASNVKTRNYNVKKLEEIWITIQRDFYEIKNLVENNENNIFTSNYYQVRLSIKHEFPDVEKWFRDIVIDDLAIIKSLLLNMPLSVEREFFLLAFFAIVRRVSRAHDGEVRPHVNLKKRERDVFEAYSKKIGEMIDTMREWNDVTNHNVSSVSKHINNIDIENVNKFLLETKNRLNKELVLVISHPPYLNCFDYIPVYKLKFLWAFGFQEIFGEMDYNTIKKSEIKSYPVNDDKQVNRYFEHNIKVYKVIYENLRKEGSLAIVIGDCTVKKRLFSVHKTFIKLMEEIGFTVEKVVYRSTHYGLGKYAYNHKANYHGEDSEKKEAIIIFKK